MPHARVTFPHAVNLDNSPLDEQVLALLEQARAHFSVERFGADPLVFRHFLLAKLLMQLKVNNDGEVPEPRKLVAKVLRDRFGRPWGDRVLATDETTSVSLVWLVFNLIRTSVPAAVLRIRATGRVPGLSGKFRWFMRQPYMTPRLARTGFPGFAVRLTPLARDQESREQISLLLVHAFLEDLRVAYRGRPWRLSGWRRTVLPVLLLDDITPENGGYRLLELINEVRNETGQWDPLLVVSTSERVPPDGRDPADRSVKAADVAEDGYWTWLTKLDRARRRYEPDAWYLRIAVRGVPIGPGDQDGTPSPDQDGAPSPERIVPEKPPWWARRVVPAALSLVLVAGLAGWATAEVERRCGMVWSSGRVAVERQYPDGGGAGECVGYSDNASYVFGQEGGMGPGSPTGAARLAEIQQTIFQQNEEAEREHRAMGSRPYLTLIYFGQLSGQQSYVPQAQQLEGMALQQRQSLDMRQQNEPILRIIVANGGNHMGLAAHTVEMLRPLVRDDSTIAGVVGLDQTYVPTVAAIQALTGLGLPMVSPTLSADRLEEASPLYFQITQPNAREADIVAQYAKQSGFRTARILYHQDEGDLYVQSLRTAVRGELTRVGVTMDDDLDWKNSASPLGLVCEYTGMLFFAGRDTDFESFLRKFNDQCQNLKPKYPIVAGDSVSRLIEDPERRARTGSKLPLMYVSDAHLVDCQSVPKYDTWRSFLDETQKEPWRACAKNSRHPLSERMELAYDATHAFFLAADSLTPQSNRPDKENPMLWWTGIPLSPGAVWQRLGTVHFDGVTGYLNFTKGQVPRKKAVNLLAIDEIGNGNALPRSVYYCGGVVEQDPGPSGDCAPGTRPR